MSRATTLALILAAAALAVAARRLGLGDPHAPVPAAALFSFAVSAFRGPLR